MWAGEPPGEPFAINGSAGASPSRTIYKVGNAHFATGFQLPAFAGTGTAGMTKVIGDQTTKGLSRNKLLDFCVTGPVSCDVQVSCNVQDESHRGAIV